MKDVDTSKRPRKAHHSEHEIAGINALDDCFVCVIDRYGQPARRDEFHEPDCPEADTLYQSEWHFGGVLLAVLSSLEQKQPATEWVRAVRIEGTDPGGRFRTGAGLRLGVSERRVRSLYGRPSGGITGQYVFSDGFRLHASFDEAGLVRSIRLITPYAVNLVA